MEDKVTAYSIKKWCRKEMVETVRAVLRAVLRTVHRDSWGLWKKLKYNGLLHFQNEERHQNGSNWAKNCQKHRIIYVI